MWAARLRILSWRLHKVMWSIKVLLNTSVYKLHASPSAWSVTDALGEIPISELSTLRWSSTAQYLKKKRGSSVTSVYSTKSDKRKAEHIAVTASNDNRPSQSPTSPYSGSTRQQPIRGDLTTLFHKQDVWNHTRSVLSLLVYISRRVTKTSWFI